MLKSASRPRLDDPCPGHPPHFTSGATSAYACSTGCARTALPACASAIASRHHASGYRQSRVRSPPRPCARFRGSAHKSPQPPPHVCGRKRLASQRSSSKRRTSASRSSADVIAHHQCRTSVCADVIATSIGTDKQRVGAREQHRRLRRRRFRRRVEVRILVGDVQRASAGSAR